MLLVPCPHCGPRNSADMRYVGESVSRPDPESATPEQWRRYLYTRSNPAGWLRETWYCRLGCRRYFTVERHTASNQFRAPVVPGHKPEAKA